jgi:prepilin-type N-terminal cleavage/methylation domain-containing protein
VSNRGFTLIELMIVVVVIGIITAIGIPNFLSMQDRARAAAIESNGHTTQLAVEHFSTENDGGYPPAATAMADILANLPGGVVYENPFTGGGGLSIGGGAAEGMVDYLDPAAAGPGRYQLDCYGEGAALIISYSNG